MNHLGNARKKRPKSATATRNPINRKPTVPTHMVPPTKMNVPLEKLKEDHYLQEVRQLKAKQGETDFKNKLLSEENDDLRRRLKEMRARLDDINLKSEESKLQRELVILKETLEKKDRKINELRRRSATTTILELALGRDEALNEVMRLRKLLQEEKQKYELYHIRTLTKHPDMNTDTLLMSTLSNPPFIQDDNQTASPSASQHRQHQNENNYMIRQARIREYYDNNDKDIQQESKETKEGCHGGHGGVLFRRKDVLGDRRPPMKCEDESVLINELRDQLAWMRNQQLEVEQSLSMKTIECKQLKIKLENNNNNKEDQMKLIIPNKEESLDVDHTANKTPETITIPIYAPNTNERDKESNTETKGKKTKKKKTRLKTSKNVSTTNEEPQSSKQQSSKQQQSCLVPSNQNNNTPTFRKQVEPKSSILKTDSQVTAPSTLPPQNIGRVSQDQDGVSPNIEVLPDQNEVHQLDAQSSEANHKDSGVGARSSSGSGGSNDKGSNHLRSFEDGSTATETDSLPGYRKEQAEIGLSMSAVPMYEEQREEIMRTSQRISSPLLYPGRVGCDSESSGIASSSELQNSSVYISKEDSETESRTKQDRELGGRAKVMTTANRGQPMSEQEHETNGLRGVSGRNSNSLIDQSSSHHIVHQTELQEGSEMMNSQVRSSWSQSSSRLTQQKNQPTDESESSHSENNRSKKEAEDHADDEGKNNVVVVIDPYESSAFEADEADAFSDKFYPESQEGSFVNMVKDQQGEIDDANDSFDRGQNTEDDEESEDFEPIQRVKHQTNFIRH